MRVLQSGVAKSGNLWLWRILQLVWQRAGLERKAFITGHPIYKQAQEWDELSHSYQKVTDVLDFERDECFFRISSIYREKIEDIDGYLSRTTHVWTHSRFAPVCGVVLPKFDRIVYLIRDPRDVAVSMAKFAFTPYMRRHYPHHEKDPRGFLNARLKWLVRHWTLHVGEWLWHAPDFNIRVLFYERLKADFEDEMGRLLSYLDIPLAEDDIASIQDAVSFSRMKKENPAHVREGQTAQWESVLTPRQAREVEEIAGPLLRLLNYQTLERRGDGDLNDHERLPRLPESLAKSEIAEKMAPAQWSMIKRVWEGTATLARPQPFKAKYSLLAHELRRLMGIRPSQ